MAAIVCRNYEGDNGVKKVVLVIDLDRCIGCYGGCQVACKVQHKVAIGDNRSTLYTMGPTGDYPDIEMYFLPVMCQQCEDPPCVKVCPTGASYQDVTDGVVRIDRSICIGCCSCTRACPYDVSFLNQEMRVIDKCDICAESRMSGEAPACVKNCAGGAIYYGDINDPESEVSRVIREAGPEHVYSLQDFGNKSACRYILRGAKWIDILPQEYKKQKDLGELQI